MSQHKTVFTTERGKRHQQAALNSAPPELEIVMLRRPDRDTLQTHLAEAEFLITERTGAVDAELLQTAPKLRLIQRLGSLTHDIDTTAAQAAGVAVCYWPMRGVIRVAEHLVMQLLAVGKKLREVEAVALAAETEWGQSQRTDEDTFAYNWSRRQDIDGLWRRTVGIIGFGEIGVELARRLKGWDCTMLYYKRRRLPETVETDLGLTYVEAADIYANSDYLVNLLPYFPETDMLLDAAVLAQMKPGAFLVSCGSGSVIDEAALAEAVRQGKLAGAAIDTFEWEPIRADNPLLALAKTGHNVLLTPHTAAGTSSATEGGREEEYTNLVNYLQGKPLRYRLV